MYLGSYNIDDYVGIPAATHRFSSGAAYAPTVLTYSIYEEATAVGLDEDVDMVVASPFDSITGCYWVRRQLTAAAGFEVGKNYLVVIKATVDSVAAIQMHTFQICAKVDAVAVSGDTAAADNLESAYDGAGYAGGTVKPKVDLDTIKTQAVTCGAGVTVGAFVGNATAALASDANGRVQVQSGTGAGQISLSSGEVTPTTASKTGYALSAAGVQAIWDALSSALTTVGSIGKRIVDYLTGDVYARLTPLAITTGAVATDAGNSATAFKTDLASAVNDYWKDCLLLLTSGALAGQVKKVTGYNGTTKVVTVDGGFTSTPADAVTFAIINR